MRAPGRLLIVCLLALAGCKRGGLNFVRTPAVGRPQTCPEGAVAVDGRLGYDPSSVRCSYADAIGRGVTTLSGQVRADDGALGVGVEGVRVSVHAVDGPPTPASSGPSLASGTTDAQGSFRFSVVLDAGDYLLVAHDPRGEEPLVFVQLALEDAPRREIRDLLLTLPVDERLEARAGTARTPPP